jgi:hypothetical protein
MKHRRSTSLDATSTIDTTSVPAPVPATALEARVAARKRELIEELIEHKTSVRSGAPEAAAKLKERLTELAHIVKEGVVDGWANIGEAARIRIDHWMSR